MARNDKPTVRISSRGSGGNVFAILAAVKDTLRKHGLIEKYNTLQDEVMNGDGDYTDAIARIRQDVNLIDTDGDL